MTDMTPNTNFIKLEGDTLQGNIATLSFDCDVTGRRVASDNDKAPIYRLTARSPRGREIEVGGIWQRRNRQNGLYYTLTINTGSGRWYANLGKFHGQDDEMLLAVIPNDYLNDERRV